MARKHRRIEPEDRAARQQAIDSQRRRLDRAREQANREAQVEAALRNARTRHELRRYTLERSTRADSRATRRFCADLYDIVKLPCGREPDGMLLASLARHRRDWFRPISTWRPEGDTQIEQQSSLLRHLLTRYPVPAFMEQAWYMDDLTEGREYRTWFLRMTRGENIRACSPPIPLTHRAAHLFLHAPGDCTIVGAMRRAQYLGMGGSDRGAVELLNTALGYPQPNERFWETALQFLANHESELRAGQIALLAAFLHWRVTGQHRIANPLAPAPVFSMKGRTLGSLLREAEVFRAALPSLTGPVKWWDRLGIKEWLPEEGADERTWSIVELLNSAELRHEGETMRHCVAHYDRVCAAREVSIWSVRCQDREAAYAEPIMTIEIRTERRVIVQARGKRNQSAMDEQAGPLLRAAARLMIQWTEREKLTINWGLLGWNRTWLLSNEDMEERCGLV